MPTPPTKARRGTGFDIPAGQGDSKGEGKPSPPGTYLKDYSGGVHVLDVDRLIADGTHEPYNGSNSKGETVARRGAEVKIHNTQPLRRPSAPR
jgi:hypothetical protein